MLRRLAVVVGPMRASRPAGRGDPDGFAGLARRGCSLPGAQNGPSSVPLAPHADSTW